MTSENKTDEYIKLRVVGQDNSMSYLILLFELKIFETIEHMRFIHNGIDFLMAHNNQISVIRS